MTVEEVHKLKKQRRNIIHSNLTLPQILKAALPSGEKNSSYQDIFLKCLYATSDDESFIYQDEKARWLQVCRQFSQLETEE
jgi:hypothetical protein